MPMTDEARGKWPRAGVTFETRRGSFVLRAELFEEGREDELIRTFARSMPDNAKAARREKVPGGVRVHWREIRVVEAREPLS